jgi:hypothetical protein
MTRWGMYGLLILIAVGAAACRNRYDPVHNDRRIARFEANLMERAARQSGCSPVQVQLQRVGELVWVANTCTGPREYFLDCRQRNRRWSNCNWDAIITAPEAAANMIGCPPQSFVQQPGPAPNVRIVQGCGQSLQMNLLCNDIGCGWVAAGPAQTAGAVAAPPPPPAYAPRVLVIQQ